MRPRVRWIVRVTNIAVHVDTIRRYTEVNHRRTLDEHEGWRAVRTDEACVHGSHFLQLVAKRFGGDDAIGYQLLHQLGNHLVPLRKRLRHGGELNRKGGCRTQRLVWGAVRGIGKLKVGVPAHAPSQEGAEMRDHLVRSITHVDIVHDDRHIVAERVCVAPANGIEQRCCSPLSRKLVVLLEACHVVNVAELRNIIFEGIGPSGALELRHAG
mmetsp:Transcript_8418/g.26094  ORF Transcript_8418/g.26094 Transcript_8418/m.26094 type:complete len:212 (-) Transcript_8418:1111-1746(-)